MRSDDEPALWRGQILQQAQLIERSRGLVLRLQAGLQRHDLGRDLVVVDALDRIQHRLRDRSRLRLTILGGGDGCLRAGEIRLDVLNGLLAGMDREVIDDARVQRR